MYKNACHDSCLSACFSEIFKYFMEQNFKCVESQIDEMREKVSYWIARKASDVKAGHTKHFIRIVNILSGFLLDVEFYVQN